MKKIVIALIILSAAAIGAVKGSLWYFTQQFVDNQIVQAKPFLQISYKEIKTSFNGSATVSGVKVFIPSVDDTIYINSIQFLAADLMSLLTLDSTLQKRQIPEFLSLLISGASINFSGNLIKMMDNPDAAPSKPEIFAALGCGNINRIGSKELSKMGYDNISSDIVLRYNFNPRSKILNYNIQDNILDMTHFNFSGEIHGVTDLDSLSNKASSEKTLKPGKFTMEMVDDSYLERKNRFCANQTKRTVDEYISEHIRQVKEYLTSHGVQPEEGLFNAYQNFLTTHGAVRFEAELSTLTGLEEFKTLQPNDIIQFIRLKLFVNGKRINEISIDIDKDQLIEAASNDGVAPEIPEDPQIKPVHIKKYRPVSVADLANYSGYRVKIEKKNGKRYKGNIKTKNQRVYEVVTRLRSGTISYFIPRHTIKNAEVFY